MQGHVRVRWKYWPVWLGSGWKDESYKTINIGVCYTGGSFSSAVDERKSHINIGVCSAIGLFGGGTCTKQRWQVKSNRSLFYRDIYYRPQMSVDKIFFSAHFTDRWFHSAVEKFWSCDNIFCGSAVLKIPTTWRESFVLPTAEKWKNLKKRFHLLLISSDKAFPGLPVIASASFTRRQHCFTFFYFGDSNRK